MIRMSQDWLIRKPLVDVQGNNGSIDADSPAASRYCVTGDTRVLTDSGLVRIEDIVKNSINDSDNDIDISVVSYNGVVNKASKFFNSGMHDIYEVQLGNGLKITGTLNHPLMIIDESFNLKWKTIEELSEGDKCVIFAKEPSLFGKNDDLLEAKMLGCMLSEGYQTTQNRLGINNKDMDMITPVKGYFEREIPSLQAKVCNRGDIFEYCIANKDFYRTFIEKYDYAEKAKDKRVPDSVFHGTKEYQKEFLRYLFEGDGCISVNLTPYIPKDNISLTYSTYSKGLAEDIQLLLLNFGVVSSVTKGKKGDEYKVRVNGYRWVVQFREKIGFVSERKNKNLANIGEKEVVANNSMSFYQEMSTMILNSNSRIKRRINTRSKLDRFKDYLQAELYQYCLNMIDSYVFIPVKSIKKKGRGVVYSIRVDSECHSFIGNGFICHNTEARLSHIADYMLKDIDKETVKWVPNFSDEELEPTVLPTRYPHLLINGINGIASGYATNIPPHNLNEIMNAVVYRVDHPDCTLDDLMKFVKGPDFPTGGIVMGIDGIRSALATGKGKVIVRGKAEVEKNQIIITEIPYEVVKCQLVKRMEDLRIDKKLAGVTEVRDESGRNGLRIVLDLKKDAPVESILNYLYKNTDLQVNINYNMTAIVDKAPKQIGLVKAVDTFIRHRQEVITKRSIFDKNKKMERQHILDGLIRALGILDEVLKVIRASANKADARANLVKTFNFTEKQAEAIVVMQLYKLTNTDVQELKDEHDQLAKDIAKLTKILEDEEELKRVIIEESKEINEEFKTPRKSVIEGEIQDIVIDEQAMIPSETVQVAITREGYVKKVSNRSYLASGEAIARHKDGDIVVGQKEANTRNTLIFFTNTGYFGKIPIYKLKEYKWKDLGDHLTSYVKVPATDKIIGGVIVEDFNSEATVVMMTQSNKIKKVGVKEFDIARQSKVTKAMTLAKGDELKFVALALKPDSMLYLTTREGKGNSFPLKGLSTVSTTHSGVKGMNVSEGDEIISMLVDPQEVVVLMSKFGEMKAIPTSAYASQSRTGSGRQLIKKGVDVDYALAGDEIVYIGALENHIQPKELTLSTSRTTGYGKENTKEDTEVEVLNRM